MIDETISHYRITKKLGAGGMGVVYEAEDTRLGRPVALKLLSGELDTAPSAHERFQREVRAASALNHPHICTVYDVGEYDGRPFLVMERMKGETLKHKIGGKPLAVEEVLELGSQIADALEAAHGAGLVHRDIKPTNIFVTDRGQAKLLDFGLVKLIAAAAGDAEETETLGGQLTQAGSAPGTVAYMSPEQAKGQRVDARTDLFSLGVVLYEMATGRLPFPGQSPAEVFGAILKDAPERPSLHNPKVPPELDRIILATLEKDRELRCQSASEARAELRRLHRDTTSATSSGLATVMSTASAGSRRGLWAGLGAAAALAVALTAFWLGRGGPAPGPAGTAAAGTPSVAVLPFVDMSPEKDQEYFTDGLTEELLNVLAKTEGLRVAARTSSFAFKGKTPDIAEVGAKLNVSTLLEGSVRKAGDKLRITAQLVNVADGFQLWSENYDRRLDDIFAVQDDIARSVAEALKVKLLVGKAAAAGGTNAEAYNAYLQGRYFELRHNEDDLKKAIGYYEDALDLDEAYLPAWVGLSSAYFWLSTSSAGLPLDEGMGKARQAAERALVLDGESAEAHVVLALIKAYYDWDWAGGEASIERALKLAPNNSFVVMQATLVKAARGHLDEALELSRQAVKLDPLNAGAHAILGSHAYYAGLLDEATAAFDRALELEPAQASTHLNLGRVYLSRNRPEEALREMEREPQGDWRLYGLALAHHVLGHREEADAALRELIEKYGNSSAFQVAEVYAYRGEADLAFEWLERAYAQRDGGLTGMIGDPLLRSLEDDPRYTACLQKMGLVD